MTAADLIADLRNLNVDLWVAGERLRYRGPKGSVTPEIQSELVKRKAEIVALLQKDAVSRQIQTDNVVEQLALKPITPSPYSRYLPFQLTDMQQAYWVGRKGAFSIGNIACHSYIEISRTGLDLERFNQAWNRLIEHHDMLRAIVLEDGRQQILKDAGPYRIEAADLRGKGMEFATSSLEATRQRMSHQVLPTDQWPLFEIRVSFLEDDRVILHFSFDLLIADIASFQRLLSELFCLYSDPEYQLTPLEITFRDYVIGEAALRETEVYRRSKEYWINRLVSLPAAPDLPMERLPEELVEARFVRRSGKIESAKWERLKARGARHGLTPSGLLLGAFAEVLRRWSHNERLTINLTLFNRLAIHEQVNEIVGDFTTLTLLEVDGEGESYEERSRRVQKQLWEDLEHRYFNGVQVLRELARKRGSAALAMPVVFTSALALDARGPNNIPMTWLGELSYGISQTPQVWLDHQVYEQEGTLHYNWDAVDELFHEGLLDDMFAGYNLLLESLCDDDSVWRQNRLDLLPVEQRRRRSERQNLDKSDNRFFVLDARMQERPDWVLGELYEGGAGIATRLENEQERNANIVVHPETGERLYRTGSLARYLGDASIELAEPEDSHIESSEYRTEPAKVESVIRKQEGVKDAAVISVADNDGRESFIFYVAPVIKEIVNDEPSSDLSDNGEKRVQAGVLTGPMERLEFKLREAGIRAEHQGSLSVELTKPTLIDSYKESYLRRRSFRQYSDSTISLDDLSAFLSCILQMRFDDSTFPKYLYGSAGGLYPVQTYLYIKPDKVAGLKSGIYYYHPRDHRLILISGEARIERSVHGEINQSAFDQSAFSLFLIGEMNAITPMYGEESLRFATLEAGLMSQLLETTAPDHQIGLCQIGGLHFDRIRDLFELEDSQIFLNSFVGGPVTNEQLELAGFLRETNAPYSASQPGDERSLDRKFEDQLHEALELSLPEHTGPWKLILVESIPRNATGEIDRSTLPMPNQDKPDARAIRLLPPTEAERTIVSIWRELLNVQNIALTDNFFELGGTSIHMVRAHNKLRNIVGKELSIVDLFEHPTVESLARHLSKEEKESDAVRQGSDRANLRKTARERRQSSRVKPHLG